MYCLLAALLAFGVFARADAERLPPPPPPTAPDSIIPSSPTSPTHEAPMEPPPTAPDKLPPTGSLPPAGTLAPEDIPNPPQLPPPTAEMPDTTEPGTPAPESPTKNAEAKKTETGKKQPEIKEVPSPPPPTAAETEVKPSKDWGKMLEPKEDQKEVEIPQPEPIAETPPPEEKSQEKPKEKEEPKPEPAPQLTAVERGRLRHIPANQKVQPQWAFQFSYSPGAFGNRDIADASQGAKATGEQLAIEFQPRFFQSLGVIGFGPTLALYPISDQFNVSAAGDASVWSLGAQARYQGRFFREQPLVPVAGFAWERLTHHLTNLGPAGSTRDANSSFDMTGFFVGVWFLLNIIEPDQASISYLQSGLVRSYLTAELRSMSGSDDDVKVSGSSYFIGVRVEF